jgi:hypothetical protein
MFIIAFVRGARLHLRRFFGLGGFGFIVGRRFRGGVSLAWSFVWGLA